MAVKSFIGKGVLLSFVVVLVISGARSSEVQSCSGSAATVGRIVCDFNAQCGSISDGIACMCNEGYEGDGWKSGTACVYGEGGGANRAKRDAGYVPGMWSFQKDSSFIPCRGIFAILGDILCDSKAKCLAGGYPHTFKCQCPTGTRGDGYQSWVSATSGCQ